VSFLETRNISATTAALLTHTYIYIRTRIWWFNVRLKTDRKPRLTRVGKSTLITSFSPFHFRKPLPYLGFPTETTDNEQI